jgi:hypothetical protein
MNKLALITFFALAYLLLINTSAGQKQYKVGVSPLILNIGDIERGESRIVTFYIVTSSPEELLVKLEASRGSTDFFNKAGYEHMIYNYSEEDASGWIKFFDNPVALRAPSGDAGGGLNGFRPINFILEIPEDADPGWHSVTINPYPSVPSGYGGGAKLVSVVSMTLLFNIPGKSVREGIILDVTKSKQTNGLLELNIYFQNTGTLTLFPSANSIEIINKEGKTVATARSNSEYIRPGEMSALKSYVKLDGMEADEYKIKTKVSYLTGYATKESTIRLAPPAPAAKKIFPEKPPEIPFWIFIIPLLFLIAYLYYRKT